MKSQLKAKGFTLVELLTVMGIIVVLISLLLPALSMVRDFSRDIQQKAQFHSIEVGIGMYEHDFGSLPPSADNLDMFDAAQNIPDYDGADSTLNYTGAMKLAEAMVGMDMLGFHPSSGFYAHGENRVRSTTAGFGTVDVEVYSADLDTANWQTATQNLDARKGPYIELENANAYRLESVYGPGNYAPFQGPTYLDDGNEGPLVLSDVFAERRRSGEKTGSPILYFKARTQFSQQDRTDYESDSTQDLFTNQHQDDIYYIGDNWELLDLDIPGQPGLSHPIVRDGQFDAIEEFERLIVNDSITSINRPYRASSYILWSAGKDGMFGTADDIFNFDRIKE